MHHLLHLNLIFVLILKMVQIKINNLFFLIQILSLINQVCYYKKLAFNLTIEVVNQSKILLLSKMYQNLILFITFL